MARLLGDLRNSANLPRGRRCLPTSTSAASQNIRSEYFESRTDTSQGTAPAPSGFRPSESAASTPPRRDASRPASARETQSRGSELLRQSTTGKLVGLTVAFAATAVGGCHSALRPSFRADWLHPAQGNSRWVVAIRENQVSVHAMPEARQVDSLDVSRYGQPARAWISPSGRYIGVEFWFPSNPRRHRVWLFDRRRRQTILRRDFSTALPVAIGLAEPRFLFSRDERFAVLLSALERRKQADVLALPTGELKAQIAAGAAAMGPDGRWLVVDGAVAYRIGQWHRRLEIRDSSVRGAVCPGPVGRGPTVFRVSHSGVEVINLQDGVLRYRLSGSRCPLAVSLDGSMVLFYNREASSLQARRVADGRLLWSSTLKLSGIVDAVVAGQTATLLTGDGDVLHVNPKGHRKSLRLGARVRHTRGICFGHSPCGTTQTLGARFSGDGKLIAAVVRGGRSRTMACLIAPPVGAASPGSGPR